MTGSAVDERALVHHRLLEDEAHRLVSCHGAFGDSTFVNRRQAPPVPVHGFGLEHERPACGVSRDGEGDDGREEREEGQPYGPEERWSYYASRIGNVK